MENDTSASLNAPNTAAKGQLESIVKAAAADGNRSEPQQRPARRNGNPLGDCFPAEYERQLQAKVDRLRSLLRWPADRSIDVHRSPTEHFRMRANFQMWHDDNRRKTPEGFYYCMFDEGELPEDPCTTSFIQDSCVE